MKRKQAPKPTVSRRVVELTKDERKALAKTLSGYGNLQEMINETGFKRDTIIRVKMSGRGLTETIEKIRGFLSGSRKEESAHAGAA